jgi:hypothetical protein
VVRFAETLRMIDGRDAAQGRRIGRRLPIQRGDDCIHVGAGDSAVAPRKFNGTGDFFVTGKVVT